MSKLTYDYRDHPEDWPIDERVRKYAEHIANEIHVDYKGRIHVTETEPYRGAFNADGSLNWERITPKYQGRNPSGLIYYIQQHTTNGLIKIGHTKDVKLRLATLETASSVALKLVFSRPGSQEEERRLHKRFAQLRVKGEWFTPSAGLLEWIRAEELRTHEHRRRQENGAPPNAASINAAARERALRDYRLKHPDQELADPAVIEREWEENQKATAERVREYREKQAKQEKLLANRANHQVRYKNPLHRILGLRPRSTACADQRHELCGGRYIDGYSESACECECHAPER